MVIKNGMKGMRRGSDLCDLPAFNKKGHSSNTEHQFSVGKFMCA